MTALRLVPPTSAAAEPAPDAAQRRALDAVARGEAVVIVGGAGTGKTSVAVRACVEAVQRGVEPERVLAIGASRAAASALRDRISHALAVPTSVPIARTAPAAAFAILGARAALLDEPRPSLISGAEQDVVLRELLEGRAAGRVQGADWGESLPLEATLLPGFREELRNLLMRAAEADLAPEDLRALGEAAGRTEWVAAADLYAEYENVMALRAGPADQGARFDPATIVARAADALAEWAEVVGGEAPAWDVVVVDDAQDVTAATVALLRQMRAGGAQVVLVGNADESVQGYRGAVPGSLAGLASAWAARVEELDVDHRQPATLRAVTAEVAARIGVKGAGSARAAARREAGVEVASGTDAVVVLTAPHQYGQSRAIAAELRRARHGLDGPEVPWGRMAVIARSSQTLRAVRSDLLGADVPCESLGDGTALHRESAVAPLLTLLRVALGQEWTEETATSVLTSRLVGLDPVGIRRLRRDLVREERAGGGARPSGELLTDALATPARLATFVGPEAVAAKRAAAAAEAARERLSQPAATPGAVIWAAWQALEVAEPWRTAAIAGSARDDADLDAVIALLRAAQTFTERLPEAGARAFLDYLEGQDFAADTLGARAAAEDAVAFATPASAQGREWDVVVIAGLEEGAWPRLTLRDSVLGAQRLADAVADGLPGAAERATGQADLRAARAAVLDDETRAFLVAVSRATSRLVITAVNDGESRPSRLVALVEQAAGVERVEASSRRGVADLRAAVARLRVEAEASVGHEAGGGEAAGGASPAAIPAASMLAALAARGVQGAHPDEWHGAQETSTDEPFWNDDDPVRVSPSKVEWVEKCTLRWAFESVGGVREATDAQQIGTLIHELAEAHPQGGPALLTDFERRWALEYPSETWTDRVLHANARDKVERLQAYLEKRAHVEVRTEQAFRAELGRAVLSGMADRIELKDGGAYVVDIKTGSAMPSVAEAVDNAQLAMYQLAIESGAVDGVTHAVGAELAFVSSGKAGTSRVQPPIDPERARERLDAVVENMAARTFVATVNPGCGSCALRRSCPVHVQGAQVSDS